MCDMSIKDEIFVNFFLALDGYNASNAWRIIEDFTGDSNPNVIITEAYENPRGSSSIRTTWREFIDNKEYNLDNDAFYSFEFYKKTKTMYIYTY